MKLTKKENEHGLSIFLTEGDKELGFWFGGNGDLYWHIYNRSKHGDTKDKEESFTITKENYGVYRLFDRLFRDIDDINIFDNDDEVPFYLETQQEIDEYLQEQRERREEDKVRCREYNHANYHELYDKDNQVITWYSDETAHPVANYLKIKRGEETFEVEMFTQPHQQGYDRDFGTSNYIPIRFRNSGSRYDPFNIVFMRMYNDMHEVDDILDNGHQIHLEEYLYEQKKLTKKPQ
jgi:hypothetical protein